MLVKTSAVCWSRCCDVTNIPSEPRGLRTSSLQKTHACRLKFGMKSRLLQQSRVEQGVIDGNTAVICFFDGSSR
ncbi:hypothetical protein K431DRAFT_282618 [Polychaeton citri CBS 116435]|uniref:Uncharacterized protein n=1 Tax=Polychaeton citri CBS 116435 TaxID=1314669 RepID=A0A9P4QE07_9PEZI|nr:hypothetical protein K431DRAFT_282618 [Polychaeton citri CBS 116435]